MIKCGWASIGETGSGRNNKAGDQTGREVKIGNWYYFGQTQVFRWKDRDLAKKYAKIVEALCNNDNVGYDMADRTTLYDLLEKNGWNYKAVNKKVECDCSQLVASAICATMGKAVVKNSMYTGNLKSQLTKTGLFTIKTAKKYLDDDDYLETGDIINAPEHHVISALENGSKVKKESKPASKPSTSKKSNKTIAKEVINGKWGNGAKRIKALKKAGYNPVEIQKEVNKLLKENRVKVGSTIRINKGAKQYGKTKGFADFVYRNKYKVTQVKGSRVVFADSKGVTMGAVSSNSITVV